MKFMDHQLSTSGTIENITTDSNNRCRNGRTSVIAKNHDKTLHENNHNNNYNIVCSFMNGSPNNFINTNNINREYLSSLNPWSHVNVLSCSHVKKVTPLSGKLQQLELCMAHNIKLMISSMFKCPSYTNIINNSGYANVFDFYYACLISVFLPIVFVLYLSMRVVDGKLFEVTENFLESRKMP